MQRFGASERESVAAIALAGLGAWLLTRLAVRLDPPVAAVITAAVVAALIAAARRARRREGSIVVRDAGLEVHDAGPPGAGTLVPWSAVTGATLERAEVATPRGPAPLGYVRIACDDVARPVLAAADLSSLGGAAVVLEPRGVRVFDVQDAEVLFALVCARTSTDPPGAAEAPASASRARGLRSALLVDSTARAAGLLLTALLGVRTAEVLWDAEPVARRDAAWGLALAALAASAGGALARHRRPRDDDDPSRASGPPTAAALAALGASALAWVATHAAGSPWRASAAWALLGACVLALPARPLPGAVLAAALGRALAPRPRARVASFAAATMACTALAARGMTVLPLALAAAVLATLEAVHAHTRATPAGLRPAQRAALRTRCRALPLADPPAAPGRRDALARDHARLRDDARLAAAPPARSPALMALLVALVLTAWAVARLGRDADPRTALVARVMTG